MSSPLFAQVQRAAANTPLLQGLAAGAIRSGTSVLYASLGEVIVERAGMVNLGLEGCMLTGACLGLLWHTSQAIPSWAWSPLAWRVDASTCFWAT